MDLAGQDGQFLSEVVENQRFWGVMWGLPMLPGLDWPAWSDATGQAIQLARPPALDGQGGWFVVRTPSTDNDGWLYGSTFDRLAYPRPGGRASKRVGDNVRSRVWRRLNTDKELQPIQVEHMAEAVSNHIAGSGGSTTSRMIQSANKAVSGAAITGGHVLSAVTSNVIFKQLPKPSVFHLWQALMELWNDSASRHGMLKMVPLDPVGLYLAVKSHAKSAAELRRSTLEKSRVLAIGVATSLDPAGDQSTASSGTQHTGASFRASPYTSTNSPSGFEWPHPPRVASLVSDGPLAGLHKPAVSSIPAGSPGVHKRSIDNRQAAQVPLSIPHGDTSHEHTGLGRYGRRSACKSPSTHRTCSHSCESSPCLHHTNSGYRQPEMQPTNSSRDAHSYSGTYDTHGSQQLPTRELNSSVNQNAKPVQNGGKGGVTSWLWWPWKNSQPGSRPAGHASHANHPSPAQLQRPDMNHSMDSSHALPAPRKPSSNSGDLDWKQDAAVSRQESGQEVLSTPSMSPQAVQRQQVASPQRTTAKLGFKGWSWRQARRSHEQASQGHTPPHASSSQSKLHSLMLPDMMDPAALVQELMTIVNYTRAAYGYAMVAGHMATLGSFLHMVGTSAFFNPVSGASVEANNEAIHTLTGIPKADVLMVEWRNSVFRPCHYLAVDRAHRRLVLCVRGSLELGDICTDLAAKPVAVRFGGGLGECLVHQGLLTAAIHVEASTHKALIEAADQYPDWPILLTGHSLGAGVSALLATMMRYGYGPEPQPVQWAGRVYCVAVACPPTVSHHVAEACNTFTVSLVHHMDFVPRLSQYSVEMALVDMVKSSPAAQLADNLSATLASVGQAFNWGNAGNGVSNSNRTSQELTIGTAGSVSVARQGSGLESLTNRLAWNQNTSPSKPVELELMTQRNPYTAMQQLNHRFQTAADVPAEQTTPDHSNDQSKQQTPAMMSLQGPDLSAEALVGLCDKHQVPGRPASVCLPGGTMSDSSKPVTQQQGPDSSDLLAVWTDLVAAVKTEANAAVRAVQGLSVDNSPEANSGTLTAVAEAGRKMPFEALTGSNSFVQRSASDPLSSLLATTQDTHPNSRLGRTEEMQAVKNDLLQDCQATKQQQPDGNTQGEDKEPASLSDVMDQVADDIGTAIGGNPQTGSDGGEARRNILNMNREEVAERLGSSKLYLPGRVLWIMNEDKAVVHAACLSAHAISENLPGSSPHESAHAALSKTAAEAATSAGLTQSENQTSSGSVPEQTRVQIAQLGGQQTHTGGTQRQQQLPDGPGMSATKLPTEDDWLDVPWDVVQAPSRTQSQVPSAMDVDVNIQQSAQYTIGAHTGEGQRVAVHEGMNQETTVTEKQQTTYSAQEADMQMSECLGDDHGIQGCGVGITGNIEQQMQGQSSDAGGLSNRLTQGFKQLKQNIEQVLSKAVQLDQKQDGTGMWGMANQLKSLTTMKGNSAGATGPDNVMLCLTEADRTLFEELSLVPSCAPDHIPDAYYSALKQLYASLLTDLLPVRSTKHQKLHDLRHSIDRQDAKMKKLGSCEEAATWGGGHAVTAQVLPVAVQADVQEAAHHAMEDRN